MKYGFGMLADMTQGGVEGSNALPEDIIEIPHIQYGQKPERRYQRAEEHAAIELQKDIAILLSGLKLLNTAFRNASADDEMQALREQEHALHLHLANLYRQIPVEIKEGRPYEFYSRTLKDLKARQIRIYREIEEADTAGDKKALQRLNLEAIRLNRLLAKAQIKVSGMILLGRSRLPQNALIRNAAIWTLQGALNSAKALEEELHYRVERLRGKERVQKLETTDWLGRLVRTFRLGGFDIEVIKPASDKEEPRISIRQQRWINAHTTLDQILQHARRGEIPRANVKMDMLIGLYSEEKIAVMERYADILSDLNELKKLIAGLPNAQPPPQNVMQDISARIKGLIQRITHPKQAVWQDIRYGNLAKSFRSQIRTVARYEPEYILILRNKADLEYFAGKLKTASEQGRLSKRNRRLILGGLARITEWTERGFVYPKQFAAVDLMPAEQFINSDNFRDAQTALRSAVKRLEKRLSDIDNITSHVKNRAAAIFSEFRDADIAERIDALAATLAGRDYDNVLDQIQETRELYFGKALVEPGYMRAERIFRLIESAVRALRRTKSEPSRKAAETEVKSKLSLIKDDLAHKRSFRVAVTFEDGKGEYKYINPGTTAKGLLKMLGKEPARTLITVVRGLNRMAGDRLSDGAVVKLTSRAGTASLIFLGGKAGIRYSPFFHAPTIEELAKVGIPYGVFAVLNRFNDTMPALNVGIFAGLLAVFGIAFVVAHLYNERAPPAGQETIERPFFVIASEAKQSIFRLLHPAFGGIRNDRILLAPTLAAAAGASLALAFIDNAPLGILLSMAAHLVINILDSFIRGNYFNISKILLRNFKEISKLARILSPRSPDTALWGGRSRLEGHGVTLWKPILGIIYKGKALKGYGFFVNLFADRAMSDKVAGERRRSGPVEPVDLNQKPLFRKSFFDIFNLLGVSFYRLHSYISTIISSRSQGISISASPETASLTFVFKKIGLDRPYTPFIYAPTLEELVRIGIPYGVLAVLNRFNDTMPALNVGIFAGLLAVFGIAFTLLHLFNERAPPAGPQTIDQRLQTVHRKPITDNRKPNTFDTLLTPALAAVSGTALSLAFIHNAPLGILFSILTHLGINVTVAIANMMTGSTRRYAALNPFEKGTALEVMAIGIYAAFIPDVVIKRDKDGLSRRQRLEAQKARLMAFFDERHREGKSCHPSVLRTEAPWACKLGYLLKHKGLIEFPDHPVRVSISELRFNLFSSPIEGIRKGLKDAWKGGERTNTILGCVQETRKRGEKKHPLNGLYFLARLRRNGVGEKLRSELIEVFGLKDILECRLNMVSSPLYAVRERLGLQKGVDTRTAEEVTEVIRTERRQARGWSAQTVAARIIEALRERSHLYTHAVLGVFGLEYFVMEERHIYQVLKEASLYSGYRPVDEFIKWVLGKELLEKHGCGAATIIAVLEYISKQCHEIIVGKRNLGFTGYEFQSVEGIGPGKARKIAGILNHNHKLRLLLRQAVHNVRDGSAAQPGSAFAIKMKSGDVPQRDTPEPEKPMEKHRGVPQETGAQDASKRISPIDKAREKFIAHKAARAFVEVIEKIRASGIRCILTSGASAAILAFVLKEAWGEKDNPPALYHLKLEADGEKFYIAYRNFIGRQDDRVRFAEGFFERSGIPLDDIRKGPIIFLEDFAADGFKWAYIDRLFSDLNIDARFAFAATSPVEIQMVPKWKIKKAIIGTEDKEVVRYLSGLADALNKDLYGSGGLQDAPFHTLKDIEYIRSRMSADTRERVDSFLLEVRGIVYAKMGKIGQDADRGPGIGLMMIGMVWLPALLGWYKQESGDVPQRDTQSEESGDAPQRDTQSVSKRDAPVGGIETMTWRGRIAIILFTLFVLFVASGADSSGWRKRTPAKKPEKQEAVSPQTQSAVTAPMPKRESQVPTPISGRKDLFADLMKERPITVTKDEIFPERPRPAPIQPKEEAKRIEAPSSEMISREAAADVGQTRKDSPDLIPELARKIRDKAINKATRIEAIYELEGMIRAFGIEKALPSLKEAAADITEDDDIRVSARRAHEAIAHPIWHSLKWFTTEYSAFHVVLYVATGIWLLLIIRGAIFNFRDGSTAQPPSQPFTSAGAGRPVSGAKPDLSPASEEKTAQAETPAEARLIVEEAIASGQRQAAQTEPLPLTSLHEFTAKSANAAPAILSMEAQPILGGNYQQALQFCRVFFKNFFKDGEYFFQREKVSAQYDYSVRGMRRVMQDVTEVQISRNQDSFFFARKIKDFFIFLRGVRQVSDIFNIKALCVKPGKKRSGDVSIENESQGSHYDYEISRGTSSSLASNAPNNKQALISSSFKGGYSALTSTGVRPKESASSITYTGVRVPFMQGLPCWISELAVILLNSSLTSIFDRPPFRTKDTAKATKSQFLNLSRSTESSKDVIESEANPVPVAKPTLSPSAEAKPAKPETLAEPRPTRIEYRGPRGDSGGALNKLIYDAAQAYNAGNFRKARDLAIRVIHIFQRIDSLSDRPEELQEYLSDLDSEGGGTSDLSDAERRKAVEIFDKAKTAIAGGQRQEAKTELRLGMDVIPDDRYGRFIKLNIYGFMEELSQTRAYKEGRISVDYPAQFHTDKKMEVESFINAIAVPLRWLSKTPLFGQLTFAGVVFNSVNGEISVAGYRPEALALRYWKDAPDEIRLPVASIHLATVKPEKEADRPIIPDDEIKALFSDYQTYHFGEIMFEKTALESALSAAEAALRNIALALWLGFKNSAGRIYSLLRWLILPCNLPCFNIITEFIAHQVRDIDFVKDKDRDGSAAQPGPVPGTGGIDLTGSAGVARHTRDDRDGPEISNVSPELSKGPSLEAPERTAPKEGDRYSATITYFSHGEDFGKTIAIEVGSGRNLGDVIASIGDSLPGVSSEAVRNNEVFVIVDGVEYDLMSVIHPGDRVVITLLKGFGFADGPAGDMIETDVMAPKAPSAEAAPEDEVTPKEEGGRKKGEGLEAGVSPDGMAQDTEFSAANYSAVSDKLFKNRRAVTIGIPEKDFKVKRSSNAVYLFQRNRIPGKAVPYLLNQRIPSLAASNPFQIFHYPEFFMGRKFLKSIFNYSYAQIYIGFRHIIDLLNHIKNNIFFNIRQEKPSLTARREKEYGDVPQRDTQYASKRDAPVDRIETMGWFSRIAIILFALFVLFVSSGASSPVMHAGTTISKMKLSGLKPAAEPLAAALFQGDVVRIPQEALGKTAPRIGERVSIPAVKADKALSHLKQRQAKGAAKADDTGWRKRTPARKPEKQEAVSSHTQNVVTAPMPKREAQVPAPISGRKDLFADLMKERPLTVTLDKTFPERPRPAPIQPKEEAKRIEAPSLEMISRENAADVVQPRNDSPDLIPELARKIRDKSIDKAARIEAIYELEKMALVFRIKEALPSLKEAVADITEDDDIRASARRAHEAIAYPIWHSLKWFTTEYSAFHAVLYIATGVWLLLIIRGAIFNFRDGSAANPRSVPDFPTFGGPSGGITDEYRRKAVERVLARRPELRDNAEAFLDEIEQHPGILEAFGTREKKLAYLVDSNPVKLTRLDAGYRAGDAPEIGIVSPDFQHLNLA
ncbi:MAG: hypothetical protein Q8N91_04035 [Candidatus Omnitrophota bacterium]|nr:hypothetical protein [Candidatus Omnitrophota bacterium]